MADAFDLFFDLAFTGAILYRPVRNEAGELVDFTFYRLNPAAQRLLGLPAQPAGTFLATFPGAESVGLFARQREAFLDDRPTEWEGYYQLDGLDHYYRTQLRRAGELLLVSFEALTTPPSWRPRRRCIRPRRR